MFHLGTGVKNVFFSEAWYGISDKVGECERPVSSSNSTCRLAADQLNAVTSCMLKSSCMIEGTPVMLQNCGAFSTYLQLSYQCLPGRKVGFGLFQRKALYKYVLLSLLKSPQKKDDYE